MTSFLYSEYKYYSDDDFKTDIYFLVDTIEYSSWECQCKSAETMLMLY